jgi:hypothetical protein
MRPESRPEKPYTNQEIVNRVYQHFFVERHERCHSDGYCQYYCVSNKQDGCAVGCLLTQKDALQIPQGEITYPEIFDVLENVYFDKESLPLLQDLQIWHDQYHLDPKIFDDIIRDYGLKDPATL